MQYSLRNPEKVWNLENTLVNLEEAWHFWKSLEKTEIMSITNSFVNMSRLDWEMSAELKNIRSYTLTIMLAANVIWKNLMNVQRRVYFNLRNCFFNFITLIQSKNFFNFNWWRFYSLRVKYIICWILFLCFKKIFFWLKKVLEKNLRNN